MNINLKQILYIVSISITLSVARYFFIQEEYPIFKPSSKATEETYSATASVDSLKNYLNNISTPKIVNIDLAKKIHENSLATFIDARDFESYKEKHIKGAFNITFEMLEQFADEIDLEYMIEVEGNYLGFFHEENKDSHALLKIGLQNDVSYIMNANSDIINDRSTVFVIYCSGDGCSLSEELAFYMLERFHIKKILIYEGGMPEWIENNLPIE